MKTYLCIDLKTFYASVECVKRGLDPFKTNLVVADTSRGKGTIALAVSPKMKSLGVKNRCRLYEIPEDIKYIAAKPMMKDYLKMSASIYEIYLKYVSKEDLFQYSIDECFLDVTSYLNYYGLDSVSLAKIIIKDILETTGITATAGIGENLFLAKVGLDLIAKHQKDNIGLVTKEVFEELILTHEPITDIWNIGNGIARRLLKYGIKNLAGIKKTEPELLYQEFGVNASFLIDHASGEDNVSIKDIRNYEKKHESVSMGQVLLEDYNYQDGFIILKEMVELLALELVKRGKVTNNLALAIGYSSESHKPSTISIKLDFHTNSYLILLKEFKNLYQKICLHGYKIRKFSLSANNLLLEKYAQVNFFADVKALNKEHRLMETINELKSRFGKNSMLKGMNLSPKALTIKRNQQIGGHNSE